jgi:hypothetical protein
MVLAVLTGWLDRQERQALAYLMEEHRVLRRQLGHRLGRRVLRQVATVVSPDTMPGWHREFIARTWIYARSASVVRVCSSRSAAWWCGRQKRIPPGAPRESKALSRMTSRKVAVTATKKSQAMSRWRDSGQTCPITAALHAAARLARVEHASATKCSRSRTRRMAVRIIRAVHNTGGFETLTSSVRVRPRKAQVFDGCGEYLRSTRLEPRRCQASTVAGFTSHERWPPAAPRLRQPRPEHAIRHGQTQPRAARSIYHRRLMPERPDLKVQLRPRPSCRSEREA